jgi:tRNA nucleotidyltransferase (CCA-adding enzyme)
LTGALEAVLGDLASLTGETRLFLVGGAVRDLLSGRPPGRDVDIVVQPGGRDGFPGRLGSLPGWTTVASHGRFGTATFSSPSGLRVDAALARKESYPSPGALPVVVTGVAVEEDLARRDFTVHAMAMEVERGGVLGPVMDPFGGREDLAAGRLRLLHPRSLSDDPTRAFRAVRYESRLGFRVAEPAFSGALAASRESGAWGLISGDRLRNSLEEVLGEEGWRKACARLAELGILGFIVNGWEGTELPPGPHAGTGLAARWCWLLAPLPRETRGAVAVRLNFSRKLRKESEAP